MAAPNTVNSVGAGSNLHALLLTTCRSLIGADLDLTDRRMFPPDDDRHRIVRADVQDVDDMRRQVGGAKIDTVVAGELLEHLPNPGLCLTIIATLWPSATLIVSVPNAFSAAAAVAVDGGMEHVHADHVCWYSPRTLRRLLEITGWKKTSLYACGRPGVDYGIGNLRCPSILAVSRRQ